MTTKASRRQTDDISRRIVDSSEDCLKVLDLEGRVNYVNGAGVRHLDLRGPADLLGRSWLDSWEGEAREAAEDASGSGTCRRARRVSGTSQDRCRYRQMVGCGRHADH